MVRKKKNKKEEDQKVRWATPLAAPTHQQYTATEQPETWELLCWSAPPPGSVHICDRCLCLLFVRSPGAGTVTVSL